MKVDFIIEAELRKIKQLIIISSPYCSPEKEKSKGS